MQNGVTDFIKQHVAERPKELDLLKGGARVSKYTSIAEALKIIDRTKDISFDKQEFEREFGAHGKNAMLTALKKYGVKKPRVVEYNGKVHIWSNDEER